MFIMSIQLQKKQRRSPGEENSCICIYSGLKKEGDRKKNKDEINGKIMFAFLYLFLLRYRIPLWLVQKMFFKLEINNWCFRDY